MSERRPLWTVVGLLALASLVLWLSSQMTWTWSQHTDDLRGLVTTKATGDQAETALVPLAVLVLALVAAVVATGGWLRRITGVVVLLSGFGVLWLAANGIGDVLGPHPAGYPAGTVLAAHGLAALAGLAVLAGGTLLVAAGHRMPRLGAKYQSPQAKKPVTDPDRELWQALDSGQDPTARQ
ncbi:Trp biosynthesis-associated membrane protein [Kutzneria albida]|uniref:Uncharacterized protein n=1 Tax=Kutzneria albida DSM 43870 TaxID=1449976 RepID=W5WI22_9PSEU|nr:Trp biosynthesis-associated membrane protein [Kutzneria albida]AHI00401.1 hypothetical protein KALB_7043 [Kutzneria albida DSM 43870]